MNAEETAEALRFLMREVEAISGHWTEGLANAMQRAEQAISTEGPTPEAILYRALEMSDENSSWFADSGADVVAFLWQPEHLEAVGYTPAGPPIKILKVIRTGSHAGAGILHVSLSDGDSLRIGIDWEHWMIDSDELSSTGIELVEKTVKEKNPGAEVTWA